MCPLLLSDKIVLTEMYTEIEKTPGYKREGAFSRDYY
jgi:hypothetical protein